jgi:hypothetical protein
MDTIVATAVGALAFLAMVLYGTGGIVAGLGLLVVVGTITGARTAFAEMRSFEERERDRWNVRPR